MGYDWDVKGRFEARTVDGVLGPLKGARGLTVAASVIRGTRENVDVQLTVPQLKTFPRSRSPVQSQQEAEYPP